MRHLLPGWSGAGRSRQATIGGLAAAAGLLAAAFATGVPGTGRAAAQPPATATNDFTAPRTPWGHPDLQGIWSTGYVEVPLERPEEYGSRELLTEAEVAGERERLSAQQDHSTGGTLPTTPRPGDTGTYNTVFSGRGREVIRTRRNSLIVDPPEARIPWRPGVREQVADEISTAAGVRGRFRREGTDGPEDRPNDRCRGVILPHRFGTWEAGGGHHRIVQSPGAVTIYYEYGPHGGAYRTIPLDGRPHLPGRIRQWLGDARGRWEGDTLVVDTTNFTDRTSYEGARDNLRLTERFTRVGPDFVLYRVTVEDETVFTRPWTMEIPLTLQDARENRIFESACHEGNYALTGILSGARAENASR